MASSPTAPEAGEPQVWGAAGRHLSLGPQPREPGPSPFPHLGAGQSEAQTWLLINKHTEMHLQPPGDSPETASSLASLRGAVWTQPVAPPPRGPD